MRKARGNGCEVEADKNGESQRCQAHGIACGGFDAHGCVGALLLDDNVYLAPQPVSFARRQSKELFANLIDREGSVCTVEEISAALREGEDDMSAAKTRLRVLIDDLKSTLAQIGREDVRVRRRGMLLLTPDRSPCDYNCMLLGDMAWVNRLYGEHMSQYSCAEVTWGRLSFEGS